MQDNKNFLGTEPIGKLLLKLSIPTVIAQLINMLYNIVDRIYIGHIPGNGSLALTGVGVCMPIIMIVSAFAALVSSGGAPRASISMPYFASKYVRFITGIPVHDTTAGFVCYRRQVLETIDLDHIRFKGYAFQIEMKFTAYKCGFKIIEVPVIFINRELGTSKMNSSIFGEAIFGVIKLKVNSWFHKFPQKK